MSDITVTLPIKEYNRLLKIEIDSIKGIDIEIINDEAISDALQLVFVSSVSPVLAEKTTGVKIMMVEHPIVSDVAHRFKKLLIIKKTKKSTNEENRSRDNS
jgi:hypothetical protein